MKNLREGWRIQVRVIGALLVRELNTRFGRENIGFLWIMVEPLLFAGLVSVVWTYMRGSEENGIGLAAFLGSGYLPLTFFRNSVGRCSKVVEANSGLMYHRQVKMLDFVFTRVLIEFIGAMMAYVFFGCVLGYFGLFPVPYNVGILIGGFLLYAFFTLSICLILAPLSELSEAIEKLLPVTVYIMIPFSGTFNMNSWLTPKLRDVMLWSPPANAMEIMRYGLFGAKIEPYYDIPENPEILRSLYGVRSYIMPTNPAQNCRRMIDCENICKSYTHGKSTKMVLRDINFSVDHGARLGLMGRNGAGKSTLIKLLGGVELPTSGRVRRGMTISWPLALSGGFQGSLTGYDNARFIARIYGQEFSDVRAFVENFTELGSHLRMPMRTYSSGMRARLAFGLSLAIEFDCYLIDEVIAVGDQNFQRKCQHELFERRADRAIILASHSVDTVRHLCSQALVLDRGAGTLYEDVDQAIEVYNQL